MYTVADPGMGKRVPLTPGLGGGVGIRPPQTLST